jgi:SAM-dependent methyltransferase
MSLLTFLRLPEAVNASDLDLPQSTQRQRGIIQQKHFLKSLYIDFYRSFEVSLKDVSKPRVIVEFGSGGGFLKEIIADVISTEILDINGIDVRCSATQIPFKANSVDAFLLFDVLHHIPDVEAFFREAQRCLKPGGRILMIEPANTFFSNFIYTNFHHEPFNPRGKWALDSTGPLSGANGALPWIVFDRDRGRFEKEFPQLEIKVLKVHTPFRYLLSGGLSFRQLLPSSMYPVVKGLEWLLTPLNPFIGMFMSINLEKKSHAN